jgi:long-chain acyl-CoA synthetase
MKDTIIDSFLESVERFPERPALLYKSGHHFEELTYGELYKYAQKLAVFMKERGVREGDRLVLISENRPEWVITDIATLIVGGILVPIHSVLAGSQMQTIIDEVEPKIILVSNDEILQKLLSVKELISKETEIVYFENDHDKYDPSIITGSFFNFKTEVFDHDYEPQIECIKHDPDRIITIIYTSGTTGRFKGVELSNKNFISNITGVLENVEVTENDKFLSILPLSHVFERTVGYYVALLRGATTSYIEDPGKLADVAKVQKPTIIIAVPRLYEKVYSAVWQKASANIIKKLLFKIAFKVGGEAKKDSLQYKMADKVVFSKVKAAFGGEIRFFVSGAASLAKEIAVFFDTLDIPVLEGYGLTETAPIITTNTLKSKKYGTVGKPLSNVEIRVKKSGELLTKGPNVFANYYKNPEATKDAFDKDGWFKTGDLVEIDSDGFVKFKAREKEILVLTTGKNVGPAIVEEKLQIIPAISQAFVFGDNEKHVAAIIVPEKDAVKDMSKEEVNAFLQKEIDEKANIHLAQYEQIKKFMIIHEPFSVENGLMTPTLKLRRKEIMEKYAGEIEGVYS